MALAKDYASVMSRKGEIMKKALGMDFSAFESGSIAFDYEKMMSSTGFSMEEVERVQGLTGWAIPALHAAEPDRPGPQVRQARLWRHHLCEG